MDCQYRGTGPYSLISQQPLASSDAPGQEVTGEQIGWLAERGFWATVDELASIKSDNVENRIDSDQLEEIESTLQNFEPSDGIPVSRRLLQNLLMTLGLNVEIGSEERFMSITLSPATDDDRQSISSGPIHRPETLNYRTYEPLRDGPFCPEVFGPQEYSSGAARFGHFDLAAPIVPYLWRIGSPSILFRLLETAGRPIPQAKLENVVLRHSLLYLDGDQVNLRAKKDAEPTGECLGTGAEGLRRLFESFPEEQLPSAFRGRLDALFPRTVLVLPAFQRPLVLLDSGNFATSDLNDLYRRLINRSNRLKKLRELNAPDAILDNECQLLQKTADQLWANRTLTRRNAALGSENRPLVDLTDLLYQLARTDSKRVDFSARASAVLDDSLYGRQAIVPELIFKGLHLRTDQPILLANPRQGRLGLAAVMPTPGEVEQILLSSIAYKRLGFPEDESPECVLHRPLSTAAIEEARQMTVGSDVAKRAKTSNVTSSWIDAGSEREWYQRLSDGILACSVSVLSSPRGIFVGGLNVTS